jgi:hypothetical protein
LAGCRIVARVGAVDRLRRKPQSWRDHLCGDSLAIQAPLQFFRFFANGRFALAVDLRHGVVVVEHHRVEPERLELIQLPVGSLRGASGRAVGIGSFAEVPGAEAEAVGGGWHGSFWERKDWCSSCRFGCRGSGAALLTGRAGLFPHFLGNALPRRCFLDGSCKADAADDLIAGAEEYLRDIPGVLSFHIGRMVPSHRDVVDQSYQ